MTRGNGMPSCSMKDRISNCRGGSRSEKRSGPTEKRCCALCSDRTQNIYWAVPWTEEDISQAGFRGPWDSMAESFRLSPSMCRLAKLFIDD